MGQLDLHAPFARAGTPRKNVQNELRTVENLDTQLAFQIALLGGGEIVVEKHYIGMRRRSHRRQFPDLARPHQRGGLGSFPNLQNRVNDGGASAGCQFTQLFQRFLGIEAGTGVWNRAAAFPFHSGEDGSLARSGALAGNCNSTQASEDSVRPASALCGAAVALCVA